MSNHQSSFHVTGIDLKLDIEPSLVHCWRSACSPASSAAACCRLQHDARWSVMMNIYAWVCWIVHLWVYLISICVCPDMHPVNTISYKPMDGISPNLVEATDQLITRFWRSRGQGWRSLEGQLFGLLWRWRAEASTSTAYFLYWCSWSHRVARYLTNHWWNFTKLSWDNRWTD